MADKLAGGVAQALDIVVKPLMGVLVYALPMVYVSSTVVENQARSD